MNTQKAHDFIRTHARPLELAEYGCLFHVGPKGAVIDALRPFQNPDGGFGGTLEPDFWNPNSSPVTTNAAVMLLHRTGCLGEPEAGDMMAGIARYLLSGDSFERDTGLWLSDIPTNNDYPHAVWWTYSGKPAGGYNPTVSLAAFLVCFGQGDMEAYRETVRAAFRALPQEEAKESCRCYICAYDMLRERGITDVIDLDRALADLREAVARIVCQDVSKYGVEYEPTPSDFICGPGSELFSESLRPLVQAELAVLPSQQQEDGGFDITWQWWTPYEDEYRQAREWWRPKITMEKLRFWQGFMV